MFTINWRKKNIKNLIFNNIKPIDKKKELKLKEYNKNLGTNQLVMKKNLHET